MACPVTVRAALASDRARIRAVAALPRAWRGRGDSGAVPYPAHGSALGACPALHGRLKARLPYPPRWDPRRIDRRRSRRHPGAQHTARLAGGSRSRIPLARRYADAPAATLLTGLGAGEWSPARGLRLLCPLPATGSYGLPAVVRAPPHYGAMWERVRLRPSRPPAAENEPHCSQILCP
jgi:hypothetical protein